MQRVRAAVTPPGACRHDHEIIGELAKVVSISCRLFGNIMGGAIIIEVVSHLCGQILAPIPLVAYFGLAVGLIQAFVFTMLTMTYLAVAMAVKDDKEVVRMKRAALLTAAVFKNYLKPELESVVDRVVAEARAGDMVITLGAGNVSALGGRILERLDAAGGGA